jgi:hypothetical protein
MENQTGPNQIQANIIGFFCEALIAAQSVIKEITLPCYSMMRGLVLFPRANHARHLLVLRKAEQSVKMIWHKEKQMNEPATLLMKE